MTELADHSGKPPVRKEQEGFKRPIILNEYAWLWIDRNGDPTSLTREAYQHLLGDESTPDQRRELYARLLAQLTEFWRAHRECAAVMHFCGLGYSRPGGLERPVAGATSDNFIDIQNLIFEPYFEKYVKDSFSPVGLMIDVWQENQIASSKLKTPVYVMNDLNQITKGNLTLVITNGEKKIVEQQQKIEVSPFGSEICSFDLTLPNQSGQYELIAEYHASDQPPVRSYRKLIVE